MENLSFFDEQQTMENLNGVKDSKHLDVVKLNYESCESLTWQELFFGYDNLCAITYSSGIGFVCELLDRFEQADDYFRLRRCYGLLHAKCDGVPVQAD